MTRKVADIKCPKCRSKTFTMMDYTQVANLRYVENGEWDKDTIIEPGGLTGVVEAQYHECEHHWRLKGVKQVTDFDEITG
tara:strand:+ start:583 stop:822 length:240 start_codon:yes stop_codon:yes gene_type:complete